jgi:hypothetical protein
VSEPEGGAGLDQGVAGDPLVATMLQKLPVPEHDPEFWEQLDARLALEPPPGRPAVQTEAALPGSATVLPPRSRSGGVRRPAGGPPRRLVSAPAPLLPPRMRRPSNLVIVLLLAVAVVVVVVAVTTLIRDNTRGIIGPTVPPATAAVEGGLPTDGVTGTTAAPAGGETPPVTIEAVVGEPADPVEAAASFVAAVNDGSIDRAWELLGPASQQQWGDLESFAAALPELAEGPLGVLGGAMQMEAAQLVLDDPTPGAAELGVVVFDAVVRFETGRARRTLELPYRRDEALDVYRVEPWSPGVGPDSPMEFISPVLPDGETVEYGTLLAADERAPVEAEIPEWAQVAVLAVDGQVVQRLELERAPGTGGPGDELQPTIRFEPPAPFAPGTHRLTVAAAGGDQVTAASMLLQTG